MSGTGDTVICHVVHSLTVGGAEVLVANMTRSMAARPDTRVVVACLDFIGPLGEQLQAEGFTVQVLGRSPGIDLKLRSKLRAFFREYRVGLVHAHQYTPWFYAGLAAAPEKLPLVFTEHGRHQPDRPRPKRVLFNQWLKRKTHAMTGVSASIVDALVNNEKLPRDRVELLYNGVDHDRHRADPARRVEVRAALGLADDVIAIGTAGRLVGIKNQAMLLRGAALLRANTSRPVKIFLAGGGPLEEELTAQIAAADLQDTVVLLGQRDDVPDLLRAWDVFVLTSLSEGTSVTLLEAMSSGLPVVATAVGGNPELVEPGVQGLLVPSNDHDALAEALGLLVDDDEKRRLMGEAGRARVEATFRFDRMVDRFLEIYHEVMA